jgi:hypothetical protein
MATGYYDNALLPNSGLMRANEPWSGHYRVMSPVWITAHTTQFAQPGWQYLDGASTTLVGGGSVVVLKSPSGRDYSAIFETQRSADDPEQIPSTPQTVQISVSGGLATNSTVHVWKTTSTEWFVQQPDITPVNSSYSIALEPDAVYTITTTSGQRRGGDAQPPSAANLMLPYADDFEGRPRGQQPRYFAQRAGSFEIRECEQGRQGFCVEQMVSTQPAEWLRAHPTAYFGEPGWANYEVRMSFLHRGPGSAEVWGRIGNAGAGTDGESLDVPLYPDGYYLAVEQSGRWQLGVVIRGDRRTLARGHVMLPVHKWHLMALRFRGSAITAWIDDVEVRTVDDATYSAGRAGFGTGWNRVQFDDFQITQ